MKSNSVRTDVLEIAYEEHGPPDGAPVILAKGQSVDSAGLIKTWAQLQRTGVLQLVVPASTTALTGAAPNSVGTWPWDPNTPLLAKSAEFTITVTK